jgi:hypothetical protein
VSKSSTEEWKNKFHPIEFRDNIKGLPPLFEFLQVFSPDSEFKVYVITWIFTVVYLSQLNFIEMHGFAVYPPCSLE